MPDQEREEALFRAAVELTPGSTRQAFLDQACVGDPALRQRLEALLAAHEQPHGVLPTQAETTPDTKFADEPPDAAVGQIIGRYKLLERVGEGGCGVVYVAEQTEPVRRRVALKVIKLGMDTKQVVARFEAERQALAMMDHPNIAKVLDAGSTGDDRGADFSPQDHSQGEALWVGKRTPSNPELRRTEVRAPIRAGRPYFVMELVRGIRITDYCDQTNLSTKDRLDLFIKVCQAIQHAHQKGIIHRDIKPSNILVTLHDGVPVPKVIDFGIAKATEGRLTEATVYTQLHQFIGTPAYMSPEQAEMSGLDIDTRSDIYSLGVLLYELLTGKTPFDAKELMVLGLDAMRRTIREKEPVRPSTRLATLQGEERTTTAKRHAMEMPRLIHQLKGDLDWIVMRCLEKDRTRRYETANGLAADLKRHLSNEPVAARPPSAAYRLQKAWRRHKLAFHAGAAVAAALVIGIVISTWQAAVATQAKTKALTAQREAETSQQAEKLQRVRADRERVSAEGNLYAAKMNLAQQAWEQNNIGRLRQLLEDTQATTDRGFEWYYWQQQTHLPLKTLRGYLLRVRSVAFSPDGQRVVTGSGETAKVWDAASGRELLTLKGHRTEIWSVAFSPDGQRIVTGSFDRTAKVWDAASGRELLTFQGHGAGILAVAFSPDGQRIVTGSVDQRAKVWEAATGRELLTFTGNTDWVMSVAFSRDGQRIVTGSADQRAKVWEAATGRELLTLRGHNASVQSVAFSPDSQRIVTGSWDQTAKVWETATGRELLTLRGHSGRIWSVAFSPDGQRIVTGSGGSGTGDPTAKVWKVVGGQELLTLKRHSGEVLSVAFSPDSQRIVTGSLDRMGKVWEVASGKELLTLTGHSGWIWSVAFSPDSQRIVTGSSDQTAKVWEAATGQELLTLTGHRGPIQSVNFSPDSQRIVTGSSDQTANVWEAATGRELLTLRGHGGLIQSVAFSPDGQRIVTGGWDQTAKVWEAATGRVLLTLKGHSSSIQSVAFSPDGQRIVTGSLDQTAKVWEAATGRELLTLKGHAGSIQSVAFSPDGQRIATGSFDQTAKVWEGTIGRELLTLKGHSGSIESVAFSLDGQRIVTGSGDQTAKVWEAARAEQVAAWQKEERAADLHLAAMQRERTADLERQRIARAADEGAIKWWLVLAPIPLATGQASTEELDIEQIEGEALLRPMTGETRSIGGGELKWREVSLKDYQIDFNAILGHATERSVAYAVCFIRSEAEQRGLQMLVGSDDKAKVYLNGKLIHKYAFGRSWVSDQDTVPDIALNAGLNLLVFKVLNEGGDWQGSIRFTDAQGNPVRGIKVTLDPEAKDRQ